MYMKNYRIKDIAVIAGVSTGTVDRVLHNRGRVSEESMEKVRLALKKMDYRPNLIARSLASKKARRIMTLIPSFVPGEYWSEVNKGIVKAEKEFSGYRLEIRRLSFNPYDSASYDAAIEEIKQEDDYQGVILATLFKKSAFGLTQWLDEKQIPYVLIDAYIENTNCIAYYGTDSYRSGYVGGKLLFERIEKDDNLLLFNITGNGSIKSTQVSAREKGFRDYLSQTDFRGSIHPVSISSESPKKNRSTLNAILKKKHNIKAGIIFNSRVYIAASYFQEKQTEDFFLIGYDAIRHNVAFLKNGIVSHLIAQRPEVQGYNSVKTLFYYLTLNRKAEKMNYMPIDILIKENIEYYNNYI
jgi:LacI family transcriptional regulator